MARRPASVLVDAAQIQMVLRNRHSDWFTEKVETSEGKTVVFGDKYSEDIFFSTIFWSAIGIELANLSKDFDLNLYEPNGQMSLFIFDAHYDDSLINEIVSSATFLKKGYEQKIRARAQMADVIYSFSLAFPNDPEFDPNICLADFCEQWGFTITRVPQKKFHFRDLPDRPGLYFGFVGNDRRELSGVSQKTVDTMLMLSGLLKVGQGRDIVLLGADTDFLPLANFVLSSKRNFYLRSPFAPHSKWSIFDNCAEFQRSELEFRKLEWGDIEISKECIDQQSVWEIDLTVDPESKDD